MCLTPPPSLGIPEGRFIADTAVGGHQNTRVTAVQTPVGSELVEESQVAGPDGQVSEFVNVRGQQTTTAAAGLSLLPQGDGLLRSEALPAYYVRHYDR